MWEIKIKFAIICCLYAVALIYFSETDDMMLACVYLKDLMFLNGIHKVHWNLNHITNINIWNILFWLSTPAILWPCLLSEHLQNWGVYFYFTFYHFSKTGYRKMRFTKWK